MKKAEIKSAGEAMVKLVANPRLFCGCGGVGQVVVQVDGHTRLVKTSEPIEVTVEAADKMTAVEVRGLQAVVRA